MNYNILSMGHYFYFEIPKQDFSSDEDEVLVVLDAFLNKYFPHKYDSGDYKIFRKAITNLSKQDIILLFNSIFKDTRIDFIYKIQYRLI